MTDAPTNVVPLAAACDDCGRRFPPSEMHRLECLNDSTASAIYICNDCDAPPQDEVGQRRRLLNPPTSGEIVVNEHDGYTPVQHHVRLRDERGKTIAVLPAWLVVDPAGETVEAFFSVCDPTPMARAIMRVTAIVYAAARTAHLHDFMELPTHEHN